VHGVVSTFLQCAELCLEVIPLEAPRHTLLLVTVQGPGVAVVLQLRCNGVTVVLRLCFSGVSVVLQ
jgi:hypothetical protein